MNGGGNPSIVRSHRTWVFMTAAVLTPFANGRNTVALAAWLAPIFLLRYTRAVRRWYSLVTQPSRSWRSK